MAKKSTSNYTAEMTLAVVTAYSALPTDASKESQEMRDNCVQEFAAEFDFHPASIRGKLVREGVYIAKTNLTKQGGQVESKDTIVEQIASFLQMTSEACDSLSKANKTILSKVRDALAESYSEEESEPEEG